MKSAFFAFVLLVALSSVNGPARAQADAGSDGGSALDVLFADEPTEDADDAPDTGPAEHGAEDAAVSDVIVLPQAPAKAVKPAARERAIEEILVTATKRTTSVGDIPASIDAFSGADLDEKGLTTLEDILKLSPGVTLNRGNNPDDSQVNIRGAGSPGGDFNRPFGLFFEDVPLLNPTLIGGQPEIDPFDLRTVEVLKGPQGTLFGGSALVGAIRFVPNPPSFEALSGSLSYGLGLKSKSEELTQQYTGMINVPLGQALSFRLSGSVRDRAGVIDDTFSGEKDMDSTSTRHLRGMASWRPSEALDVLVTHQRREVIADAGMGASIDNDQSRQVNGLLREAPDRSVSDLDITSLKLNWAGFEAFDITLLGSLMNKDARFWRDASFGSVPAEEEFRSWLDKTTTTEQQTYELRLVSARPSESGWSWLSGWDYAVGLFYMRSDQLLDIEVVLSEPNPMAFPVLPVEPFAINEVQALALVDGTADAREQALFFDVTRPLLDRRLDLNLGGRLFRQVTPVYLLASAAVRNPGDDLAPPAPLGEPSEDTLIEQGFNPKLALTWHFDEEVSAFLGAAKGFRFGGVNADPFQTGEPPVFYESDSLWNFELGARTAWLDNKLRFDSTLFWVEWDNKQLNQLTSSTPPSEYIINIGGSRMRGIEFALQTLLPRGWSWSLNGAYVDSRNTQAYSSPSEGQVPKGTREGSTPVWTGASVLGLDHQWAGWDFHGALTYSYRARLESSSLPLKAIGIFDFSFLAGRPDWRLQPEWSLQVLNVLNDDSLQAGGTNGLPKDDPDRLVLARTVVPRTAILNLKLSF